MNPIRRFAAVAAMVTFILAVPDPGQAAVLTVDTLADDVSTPGCSLRAALINAEHDDQSGSGHCAAGSGADTVRFASALSGHTITLNGSALPTITKDLVIEGPDAGEADSIVIDGNEQSQILNVEVVDGEPVEVTLRNLTLTRARGNAEHTLGTALRAFDPAAQKMGTEAETSILASGSRPGQRRDGDGHSLRGEPLNMALQLTDVVVRDNAAPEAGFAGGGIGVLGGSLVLERSFVGDNNALGAGGGIAVLGELALVDSLVEDNVAEGEFAPGGGIYVAARGDVTISGSVLRGNVTTDDLSKGGGMFVDAGNVTMTNSTLTGNATQGDDSAGGGLFVYAAEIGSVDVELTETLVLNNQTIGADSHGGGVALASDESPGTLTLIETHVRDNATAGIRSPGGGVVAAGLAFDGRTPVDLVMRKSVVSGNATEGNESPGGGVSVEHGDAVVERSTVSGNSTTGSVSDGAGIHVFNESSVSGLLEIANASISGNDAEGDSSVGGGVVASFGTAAQLHHATLVDNADSDGTGGVHLTSGAGTELVLANSLVVQSGSGSACSADSIDDSHSLATDTSCTGSATPAGQIAVGALDDNGGPTQTHALARSSVAVDAAGDCVGDLGIGIDQRGESRPGEISLACDIGAFEHQSSGVLFRDRFE